MYAWKHDTRSFLEEIENFALLGVSLWTRIAPKVHGTDIDPTRIFIAWTLAIIAVLVFDVDIAVEITQSCSDHACYVQFSNVKGFRRSF